MSTAGTRLPLAWVLVAVLLAPGVGRAAGAPEAADRDGVELVLAATLSSAGRSLACPDARQDADIVSPKSVRFTPDGSRVFVNSLEAMRTVVYDAATLDKCGVVRHEFRAGSRTLFREDAPPGYAWPDAIPKGSRNVFLGKPVEGAFSHGGRFYWTPYYRRDFDRQAKLPSAVAVVDAASLDILRVIPLGPIPKGIAVSPDGRYVALAQWGDNCVTLIDVSSGDPGSFAYAAVIPVGGRLDMDSIPDGADRDKVCGQCLRGMAFSPDGKVLFVGRLGGGGLAVIDLPPGKRPSYRGTLHDVPRTPRDLRVSPDGRWLYLSASVSGVVARARLSELVAARGAGRLALPPGSAGFRTVAVGTGARSLALTGDGALLFVAVNNGSEIVAVRTADLRVVGRAAAPPYPVGLDVSPDGRRLWVASQGRDGRGGNVVSIYDVRERQVPLVAASRPPE